MTDILLSTQLEFIDYKIGKYIFDHYGYYIGTFNNRIMLTYVYISEYEWVGDIEKYIEKCKSKNYIPFGYYIANELEFKYILNNNSKHKLIKLTDIYQYIVKNNKFYDINNDEFKINNILRYQNTLLKIVLVKYL